MHPASEAPWLSGVRCSCVVAPRSARDQGELGCTLLRCIVEYGRRSRLDWIGPPGVPWKILNRRNPRRGRVRATGSTLGVFGVVALCHARSWTGRWRELWLWMLLECPAPRDLRRGVSRGSPSRGPIYRAYSWIRCLVTISSDMCAR